RLYVSRPACLITGIPAPSLRRAARLTPSEREGTRPPFCDLIRSAHGGQPQPPLVESAHRPEVQALARTAFIDHIGIGVPDLVAAKQYYDELMAVLGLREWFATGPEGPLNYGPDGARGTQLFFYQAEEPGIHSRRETGLHHLAFLVES